MKILALTFNGASRASMKTTAHADNQQRAVDHWANQPEIQKVRASFCVYCGDEIKGEVVYSIHRDGYCEGPEVPLCLDCGDSNGPSLHTIWARIANPEPLIEAMRQVTNHETPNSK